jgi:predicted RNase H-like HicB family nuclease
MKYRAVIKKSDDWWIGWLIDLPGVNAQEKSRDELLESLRIGAEDMLATDIPFIADAQLTTIDVPNPNPDEPEPKYDHCFTSWIKK